MQNVYCLRTCDYARSKLNFTRILERKKKKINNHYFLAKILTHYSWLFCCKCGSNKDAYICKS